MVKFVYKNEYCIEYEQFNSHDGFTANMSRTMVDGGSVANSIEQRIPDDL